VRLLSSWQDETQWLVKGIQPTASVLPIELVFIYLSIFRFNLLIMQACLHIIIIIIITVINVVLLLDSLQLLMLSVGK
jgi:hypothetical protein